MKKQLFDKGSAIMETVFLVLLIPCVIKVFKDRGLSLIMPPHAGASSSEDVITWFAISLLLSMIVFLTFTAVGNIRTFTINDKGVTISFLFLKLRRISWKEMAEAGIIELEMFCPGKEKKRRIYFSRKALSMTERMKMCSMYMNSRPIPPKGVIYVPYNEKNIEFIQNVWGEEMVIFTSERLNLLPKELLLKGEAEGIKEQE